MPSTNYTQLSADYQRIEQAILTLGKDFRRQPSLKEMAKSVALSEYHFQRLFSRWVGISPKRFLQFLTKEYAKRLLEDSHNLLDVAYESGLSGTGRLHELFVTCEAVTPGEFKNRGEGLQVFYGFHPSPFGECLLALTERGICSLAFVQKGDRSQALKLLEERWMNARLIKAPSRTRPLIDQIYNPIKKAEPRPLHLFLSGTNFQIKVWEALLRIPPGAVVSYEDIAVYLGMPNASRAVGNAVAQNPIAFIIPCHRVVRKLGDFGNYRWGTARKKAMVGWEAVKRDHRDKVIP
ncbi:MAG: bifunctional helix-turn-helix domain-containing protein/methylated-DNA--[protein]-cysteine S-methyltransferase [candidate division KSB1 bacterium]|nr:bifunctional helix-turn-helix domain-containing protein/methylated-DNA--[protein]-cysteine S-methyltransferase [candidate division KSB1 bacterium]MDZ7304907.1 bifunctional helix-turn-helix domain-containing protein/methylated-DNA--[protein]-cysteine S-methyltransferase [candidate division KSB1 bacterium]MDZ7313957.1 bifunctional helix-turn-helix domain-containing protein/methylated-DNA--[protein]-cysteine S-methyltransferase [candidate division KSB1 bacterium]